MRLATGTVTVGTAGTRVQAYNAENKVKSVTFKASSGNTGLVYVGINDVAAATGFELSAGQETTWSFAPLGGNIPANTFYADAATSGDKVSWWMILEG
jgi:hypothetical protein